MTFSVRDHNYTYLPCRLDIRVTFSVRDRNYTYLPGRLDIRDGIEC